MKKSNSLPLRTEVLANLFSAWAPAPKTEIIATADGYGRVLARDVLALCDKPVVRASKMDGVGIKSAEFSVSLEELNRRAAAWVLDRDYCRADTGDDFPDEFDAVVQIEDVELLPNGGLRFADDMERPITAGYNVAPRGSSIEKGTVIGRRGSRLTPSGLGALCIGAVAEIEVFKKPVVAFIPTGSELIPLGQIPERGQSVDSNSIMAKAMLEEMGAETVLFPILKDDRESLAAALDKALAIADIVVMNAGTSKGGEDYTYQIIEERGQLLSHGVAAAPGKPLAVAVADGKPVINVAGPPAACFNGLDWCVRPCVAALLEQPKTAERKTVKAKLISRVDAGGGERFEAIVRIELSEKDGELLASPVSHRNRHTTAALIAPGLYVTKIPPEPTGAGDIIEVEILD
jgi:molybdopterin molybdotransferase/putative molybdopterin biosynthesis protein